MSITLKELDLKEEENAYYLTIKFDDEYSDLPLGATLCLWKDRPIKDVIHNLFLFVEAIVRITAKE